MEAIAYTSERTGKTLSVHQIRQLKEQYNPVQLQKILRGYRSETKNPTLVQPLPTSQYVRKEMRKEAQQNGRSMLRLRDAGYKVLSREEVTVAPQLMSTESYMDKETLLEDLGPDLSSILQEKTLNEIKALVPLVLVADGFTVPKFIYPRVTHDPDKRGYNPVLQYLAYLNKVGEQGKDTARTKEEMKLMRAYLEKYREASMEYSLTNGTRASQTGRLVSNMSNRKEGNRSAEEVGYRPTPENRSQRLKALETALGIKTPVSYKLDREPLDLWTDGAQDIITADGKELKEFSMLNVNSQSEAGIPWPTTLKKGDTLLQDLNLANMVLREGITNDMLGQLPWLTLANIKPKAETIPVEKAIKKSRNIVVSQSSTSYIAGMFLKKVQTGMPHLTNQDPSNENPINALWHADLYYGGLDKIVKHMIAQCEANPERNAVCVYSDNVYVMSKQGTRKYNFFSIDGSSLESSHRKEEALTAMMYLALAMGGKIDEHGRVVAPPGDIQEYYDFMINYFPDLIIDGDTMFDGEGIKGIGMGSGNAATFILNTTKSGILGIALRKGELLTHENNKKGEASGPLAKAMAYVGAKYRTELATTIDLNKIKPFIPSTPSEPYDIVELDFLGHDAVVVASENGEGKTRYSFCPVLNRDRCYKSAAFTKPSLGIDSKEGVGKSITYAIKTIGLYVAGGCMYPEFEAAARVITKNAKSDILELLEGSTQEAIEGKIEEAVNYIMAASREGQEGEVDDDTVTRNALGDMIIQAMKAGPSTQDWLNLVIPKKASVPEYTAPPPLEATPLDWKDAYARKTTGSTSKALPTVPESDRTMYIRANSPSQAFQILDSPSSDGSQFLVVVADGPQRLYHFMTTLEALTGVPSEQWRKPKGHTMMLKILEHPRTVTIGSPRDPLIKDIRLALSETLSTRQLHGSRPSWKRTKQTPERTHIMSKAARKEMDKTRPRKETVKPKERTESAQPGPSSRPARSRATQPRKRVSFVEPDTYAPRQPSTSNTNSRRRKHQGVGEMGRGVGGKRRAVVALDGNIVSQSRRHPTPPPRQPPRQTRAKPIGSPKTSPLSGTVSLRDTKAPGRRPAFGPSTVRPRGSMTTSGLPGMGHMKVFQRKRLFGGVPRSTESTLDSMADNLNVMFERKGR